MRLFGPPDIDRLAAKGDVPRLVKATAHPDADVRRDAASALGRLGDPAACPALMHLTGRLAHGETSRTREALRDEPDPRVHAAALEALAALVAAHGLEAEPDAVDAIVVDAAGGRRAAGCSWNQDPDPLLVDVQVREAARRALVVLCERYADRIGIALLVRLVPREGVFAGMQWHHSRLLQDLVVSLGEVGARVLLEGGGRWDPADAGYVVSYLRWLGPTALRPALEALGSREAQTRQLAAEVLGRIGDPRAAPRLAGVLTDTDAIVRLEAARALDKLGWTPTTEAERLDHLAAERKWKELQHLGAPAVDVLVRTLTQTRVEEGATVPERERHQRRDAGSFARAWEVRSEAARTLGRMSDERAVEPLVEALRGPDVRVQAAAAEALGKLADQRAVEPLVEVAGLTVDPETVTNAAVALRKLHWSPPEGAVPWWWARSAPSRAR